MGSNSPGATPAGSPAFRRLVQWIGGRCLRWFYRETRVLYAERIPATGPVLFMGNHPNDLPDVLLGYQATTRPLRYVATVSAATAWLARKTYEGLGVIPVTRIRDVRMMKAAGVDVVAINRAATDAVAAALAAGEIVGAFPEGGVRDLCALDSFRTGVASMILKYVDTAAENDLQIVPFGLQYEAPRTFGSDVGTVIGTPFSVRQWQAAQGEAQDRGAAGLTRAMHTALAAVTRNAPSWEIADRRDQLIAAMAGRLAPRDPLATAPGLVAAATHIAASTTPEAVRCQTAAAALADAVARAGGIPTGGVDHARLLHALAVLPRGTPVPVPSPVMTLLAAPVALLGWVIHGPVFLVVRALADRKATVRTDVVARRFVPGLHVVAAWYLLLALVALTGLLVAGSAPLRALPLAALFVALLPRLGDLAVAQRHAWVAWRLIWRGRRWRAAERRALAEASATLAALWGTAAARAD